MTPTMLRHLWSVIETTQANRLLSLDDASLVSWLSQRFRSDRFLDNQQMEMLDRYIESKLPLIRDLASQRAVWSHLS